MHYILAVLVGVILLLNSLPFALAQSNLRDHSDEQRLTIAQQNVGDAATNDRAFWNSVKDSKNPDEMRAYLEQFPTGIFATLARMRLKVLETGSREINKEGRFIAYDNGTVLDTRTNLMWAAKDNGNNINWADAKFYCENYRGGGYTDWRMPTQDELAGLYDSAKTYKSDCGILGGLFGPAVHLTELIRLTCSYIWASETGASGASVFGFSDGPWYWSPQSFASLRALPVRSAK